jgi:hypothetical protein
VTTVVHAGGDAAVSGGVVAGSGVIADGAVVAGEAAQSHGRDCLIAVFPAVT